MSSFLSDAKAKLQHTNKLSLAPKELKPLGDLLSTEKGVVTATLRISTETRRAADALKEWGFGEGDDLSDVLSKLSALFDHLANANTRYADHLTTCRLHFKSVRMREENLAHLKKARDSLGNKIAALEKKIAKMSPENKDLPASTDKLREFKGEMVGLEHSVANEEARLSDFKRETVREAMNLKLGALLELAEKMTIVSELGKLLVDEVPQHRTEPGAVRAPYYGTEKTQSILVEAQRCLAEVTFNPNPAQGRFDGSHEQDGFHQQDSSHQQDQYLGHTNVRARFDLPPIDTSHNAHFVGDVEAEQGANRGDDSPYGGFDAKHQSILPSQLGLAYTRDDSPPGSSVGTHPSPPRTSSPPPRPDFDPNTQGVHVSSPPATRPGGRAPPVGYDPIRAAAQLHARKGSQVGDYQYPYDNEAFYARNHSGVPVSTVPPNPVASQLPTPTAAPPASPHATTIPPGRPSVVRGDSALGSKHGFDSADYLAGGRSGDFTAPKAFGIRSPASGATDASSFSSANGKRTNAGAFRRNNIGGGAGGLPQVTGYQGHPPNAAPSASESIKQQYIQQHAIDPATEIGGGEGDESEGGVAPLRVQKRASFAPEPKTLRPKSEETGPPAYPSNGDATTPISPSAGFAQNRYVTNLD